jgi:hypothetical protein
MNNLSFNIRTSKEFLAKLREDYDELLVNKLSSRIALNCAMTSWHLSDWIFHEYESPNDPSYEKLKKFQRALKSKCPSLQVMHDLANGTKHFKLTNHNAQVQTTELKRGAYSSAYSRGYDISALMIEMNDGSTLYFQDEILKTINFWKDYLETLE